jgi:hypothetical protein
MAEQQTTASANKAKNSKNVKSQKKATRPWLLLIVVPFILLVVIALLQFIISFLINNNSTGAVPLVVTIINLLSVLIGIVSVCLIILLPVWIIMFFKAKNRPINIEAGNVIHDPKSKTTAVLLAIFLAQWTWLYTYDKDSTKFWVNTLLGILTAGFWLFIAWIWAIVIAVKRPQEFYTNYPNG